MDNNTLIKKLKKRLKQTLPNPHERLKKSFIDDEQIIAVHYTRNPPIYKMPSDPKQGVDGRVIKKLVDAVGEIPLPYHLVLTKVTNQGVAQFRIYAETQKPHYVQDLWFGVAPRLKTGDYL